MPKFEIEIDDKGEVVGKPAAEIDALFKRTETGAYGGGLKKGREDALTEAQVAAEAKIAAERAKWEKENPVQRAKELEEENLKFRESEATLMKRFNETSKTREENHAKEIADKAEQISKRDRRLAEQMKATIRAEAVGAGARDESLGELEVILGAKVAYDEDLEPYVKGDDGKPILVHGKPQAVSAFVKAYLDGHPHHRKATAGAGGGARGGASLTGQHGGDVSEKDAIARIESGDRSPGAVNALFQATRKKAS